MVASAYHSRVELLYGSVERALAPLLRRWFRWDMDGLDRLRPAPAIIAANHVSYLDPFIMAYALHAVGGRARFLAKAELFGNPVLGTLLRRLGQIPVSRGKGDVSSLQRAEDVLWAGGSVVIFPEATIGPGLPLLPCKTGAARLSVVTGVPITPVALWGGQRVLPKGGSRRLRPGTRLRVRVGAPFAPSSRRTDPEVVKELTGTIRDTLTELLEPLAAPETR